MTIGEIKARWAAATEFNPAPWKRSQLGNCTDIEDAREQGIVETDGGCYPPAPDTADAIASAPSDIAYLLEKVEELTKERDQAWKELHDARRSSVTPQ